MIHKIISFIMSVLLLITGLVIPGSDIHTKLMIRSMTLEQKIGQMLMPDFTKWDGEPVTEINDSIAQAICKYGFGGVILFSANCKGTEQTARLVSQLQAESVAGLAGIPLFIGADQEGGYIIRLQTGTGTVGNMALGAINDEAETKADASRIGHELSVLGINTDFAPDVDVNTNPANPVIGVRSFSSDPNLVAKMSAAYIQGLHEYNVLSAAKHFPGHGDTDVDSHTGLPLIDKSYETLKNSDLIPFKAAIDAGTDMIMMAHIVYPQIETNTYTSTSTGEQVNIPATLSKKFVTDILRKDMGFKGVVTTDAMNMAAIASNFDPADAAIMAINAGVDILLMPVIAGSDGDLPEYDKYIGNIVDAVKSGKISEERINESVIRILTLKAKRGLLKANNEDVELKVKKAKEIVGSKAHYDAELKTAEKAVTVLKNDGNVLPLKPSDKTLFLYPYENEELSLKYGMHCVSEELNAPVYCYRYTSPGDFDSQLEQADTVVIYTEMYNKNYINPNHKYGWQSVFVPKMIEKAHNAGKKAVVISIQLPYDAAAYNEADAVMLAYGSREIKTLPDEWNGEVALFGVNIPASVTVLFGAAKPMGKSPVDIPKLNEDNSYSDTILYPLGSGLTLN